MKNAYFDEKNTQNNAKRIKNEGKIKKMNGLK